jgi:hypothetical protein
LARVWVAAATAAAIGRLRENSDGIVNDDDGRLGYYRASIYMDESGFLPFIASNVLMEA